MFPARPRACDGSCDEGVPMTLNPYKIHGPACISVSGGRSSGLLLFRILEAHTGRLPSDVYCVFANTGEEAEGTLLFVREMAERWNVPIRWVEFSAERRPGLPADFSRWREVDYCSAARAGEPFDAMVDWKKYLPNHSEKLCTEWLKVRAIGGLMSSLGFTPSAPKTKDAPYIPGDYDQIIGIRADEPKRIASSAGKPDVDLPLVRARVTRGDVAAFWAGQSFDLRIDAGEGNCRLCFEKGREQLRNVVRDAPDGAGIERWIGRERRRGALMRKGHSYEELRDRARAQLPILDATEREEHDLRPCACGD